VLWKGRSSCYTSGTRRVILVTNPVISNEGPGITFDKRNISWSFVTHIFRNGLQSHGGDRKTTDVAFIDRSSTAGREKFHICFRVMLIVNRSFVFFDSEI
jgi:hypothetical protein